MAPSTTSKLAVGRFVRFLVAMHELAYTFKDPMHILNQFDMDTIEYFTEKLGIESDLDIDELDIEDAVDSATIIAGHQPVHHDDLIWEIA
jgi:hypothetical protein